MRESLLVYPGWGYPAINSKTRLVSARQLLFDPEPDGVPGPAQDAGLRDCFQRQQRHFGDQLVIRQHLQRTDCLAFGEGRHQGIRPGLGRRPALDQIAVGGRSLTAFCC